MSDDNCLCHQHRTDQPGLYTCSRCGRAWFMPQTLTVRVDGDIKGKHVLRVTPEVEKHSDYTITPVRVVSVTECVCGQGVTFCSCTKCRGCKKVIDGADRGHVCSGLRELNQQERRAHSRCNSVGPQGLSCEAYGRTAMHSLHYAYQNEKKVQWVNDWEQPPQIERRGDDDPAKLPNVRMADDKALSDLGGLLSEVVWEQRQMAKRSGR